jgi:hypothetical protein
MIIAVAAGGVSPQARVILPFQVTGKSMTSQVTTRGPTRITILITLQRRDVGHKSPTQKKRKTLVEPDLGMKNTPEKNRSSKSDGDLLNLHDTDDVMSDNPKSCLSITDDNGLSFTNLDEDDKFGFGN